MFHIGHNSESFERTPASDPIAILPDDHKRLFHFAKWHIDDYILGTQGMGVELEGGYIRFLMRLYQRGKPLPNDDRFMCVAMGLSLRVWKRLKKALVDIGKIIIKQDSLTNARFEKERKARAEQLRKQAEAATKQWEQRRRENAASEKVSPKFEESLDEVSPKLFQNDAKKVNKNNETQDGLPYILKSKEKEIDKKEIRPNGLLSDLPSDAPPKNRKAKTKNSYTSEFEEFWKIYPRKEAKPNAFRAWKKLTLDEQRKAWLACKKQIQSLTERMTDPAGNFCPMPASWLNGRRFEDVDTLRRPQQSAGNDFLSTIDVPESMPMPREEV